ncbi:MAG: hypothetical protein LBK47_08460 [Prevotellaceae bacterium]|jgi:hypothetical protein|nr:hypothetical protein [Prevotellaceae bacterium]
MAQATRYQQLSEAIPLYRVGEGFAVDKTGSLTVGYKVKLPAVHNIAVGDFAVTPGSKDGLNLNVVLQHAIKDLPEGYLFHQQDWQWFAPPLDIPNEHNFLNHATRQLYGDQQVFSHATFFFLTHKNATFKDADFSTEAVKRFTEQAENFLSKVQAFSPVRMTDEDWLSYLEGVFAVDHSPHDKILFDVDFKNGELGTYDMCGYAVNGDKCISQVQHLLRNGEKSSPESDRYNSWTFPLTWKINVPKVVNNIVFRAPRSTIKAHVSGFESKIALLSKVMQGSVEQAQEIKALIDGGVYTPVLHHYNVFYFLPKGKKEEQGSAERRIRAGFSELHLKPSRLTVDAADVFLGSIGGCAAALRYPMHLYPAFLDEVVCFSNLEGSYAQSRTGIVFSDSLKQPVAKDLFFEPYERGVITNWNMNVIGPSGTGKSVFTNYVLSTMYYMDFFFVVIDIGDSYVSLCELLKGKYLRLDAEGKSLSTNPFLLPMVDPKDKRYYKDIWEELEALIATLFIAWDPLEGTEKSLRVENQNSRTVMENLLVDFLHQRYEKKQEYVNFDDFYAFVEHEKGGINTKFFDVESFLLVMKKYRSDGSLGFLFNGKENLNDFSGYRMIVFELGAIEKNPTLFRLVTAMITMLTNRIISKARARMRQVWMDECWRMLMDPHFGVFINMLSKTIRKADGGISVIVQELGDILKSAYADAIINNANTFVALSHEGKESQIAQYATKLNMTADQMSLLLSMKIKDRSVFIKQGAQCGVYGVNISPEHYAVFTSTRTEKEALRKLIEEHEGNIPMAVEAFVDYDLGAVKKIKK